MNRNQKEVYVFISDDSGKYYRASEKPNGDYEVTSKREPLPIKYNPSNLLDVQFEFGTNKEYNSLVRTVSYPLEFVKDGAAILRYLYWLFKGTEQKAYIRIIEWNGTTNIYDLSYFGKFDLSQKSEDPKTGKFTVPTVDDSAWGVLQKNDKVTYAVDCSPTNPKAIKVLIDGLTLLNRYTYQPVQSSILDYNVNQYHTIPFVLVNQDGDSSGIITKNQTITDFGSLGDLATLPSWFLSTLYPINGVKIQGNFSFEWSTIDMISNGIRIFFRKSSGTEYVIFSSPGGGGLIPYKIYDIPIDLTFDLAAGESMFFIVELNANTLRQFQITPLVTNIFISTKTTPEPQVVYGLRAIDYVQQLVELATDGRFTIGSEFLTANNKDVVTCGESFRGSSNAKIYSSFSDFFTTFNSIYFMAIKNKSGNLFIEKFTDVYNRLSSFIDLGECIDVSLSPASEFLCNEIKVGSPKQDYRHPSGRLEFNSTNTYSVPMVNVDKELNLISKYRLGCFDEQFLILDYKGSSTKDNNGDKSVYLLKISDEKASALENIETFENINVDAAPLQPIIKSPLDNDTVNYNKPVIKGIAPAFANVKIYVDTVLDGSTSADANGNWTYNIANALSSYVLGVTTGLHVIQATYTDLSAPNSQITLFIDDSYSTALAIIYPQPSSNLYNNKPLLKGAAQRGTVVNIDIDGVVIGSVVADNSCRWEFQSPLLSNASHVITINGSVSNSFVVDNDVSHPLITYIGSELDGFPIVNTLPLIKGVSQPNIMVDLYLNYISYVKLGSVLSDANGNWEFQVVPINYIDPVTTLPVIVAPIRDGLSVVSTSLVNLNVVVAATGYKLSRPAYSSITGVTDNTVWNTEYSPKRMLENHYPMLSAIMAKQKSDKITFQTADKNGNLRTILGSKVTAENVNIPASSLGSPAALLENAIIKVPTKKSFSNTLYDFNNGGIIKATYRGTQMLMLAIGSMKIKNITSDVQEWKLLLSPDMSFMSLLNMYKNGMSITLNKNEMYHSDYNSLHFVTYNFINVAKYNFETIYDDWFNNRNDAWSTNPNYIQKYQTSEVIKDQIITNGLSSLTLKMYRCSDAKLIDTINYNPVTPAPIALPEIVLEAEIDFSSYPEDQYFFVLHIGETPISISERVETKEKWENTILIEASNSSNLTGVFFSTGFKTIIRVEGLLKKLQPELVSYTATFENGDTEMLSSNVSRKRVVRFGTAYGLPDYLYLKIADAITLDECMIEGVLYTIAQDEKINPSDDIDGHPLYYYNVVMNLKENSRGKVFPGVDGIYNEGVVLVIDALAFGLPPGTLYKITLD